MQNEQAGSSVEESLQSLFEPSLGSLFWPPSRLGSMSAWWGHVPFAHWLVSALQPTVLVELGTHNGVSFAAFCEAVQRNKFVTKCYAVDTWMGDEQAGQYGEEVYRNLSAFTDARYGGFAELMRMRFDDALAYFADHTVDLLHIDGFHTYEAVKADFDQWLPKMSSRGVVILHDTNVRERDFGVWKLWSELQARYPTFEFFHAHGLGVAAVGDSIPEALSILSKMSPVAANMVRDRLAQLGARWVANEKASQLEEHSRNLEQERERAKLSLSQYQTHVSNLETERSRSDGAASALNASLAALQAGREQVEADAARLRRELEAQASELLRLTSEERQQRDLAERLAGAERRHSAVVERLKQRIDELIEDSAVKLNDLRSSLVQRDELIQSLYQSTSWLAGKPLRGAKKTIQFLAQQATRSRRSDRAGGISLTPSDVADPVSSRDNEKPKAPEASDPDEIAILNSGLFDSDVYRGRTEAEEMGLTPVSHYLLHGETMGLAPSESFDPVFYKARYGDVAGQVANVLVHYIRDGYGEGREALPLTARLTFPTDRVSSDKATVIVIVHEATRTGAPILAWNIISALRKSYNVIVLLRRGGPLAAALDLASSGLVALPDDLTLHDAHSIALAAALKQHYDPLYVVANSVESRYFVSSLEAVGLPVVALVHEFSSTVRPPGCLHQLFATASEVVFSAQIVADAALADYSVLPARTIKIIPQGRCVLPSLSEPLPFSKNKIVIRHPTSLPAETDTIVVIGAGTITSRKGVEFFIAAAASVKRRHPALKIRFIWIGDAYSFDENYFNSLLEQVQRSDVDDVFGFAGELEDLSPFYERADMFLLSSRLDPLPNVTIDAATFGIPVVCFDRASGFADVLRSSSITQDLVVPYLDVDGAANLIASLAVDQDRRKALGDGMRAVAAQHFDMTKYVEKLDALGRRAADIRKQTARDVQVLSIAGSFNASLYLGAQAPSTSRSDALTRYLHASRLATPRGRSETGRLVRRPLEGFHPLVYAECCKGFDESSGEDPLAHFVRTGQPEGPWKHEVIRAGGGVKKASRARVVVHGHFHYPELADDFIARVQTNHLVPDLLLTTTSEPKAEALQEIVAQRRLGSVKVLVTPNRGRDVAPLLTSFGKDQLADYDIVGHFHGKRSPHADANVGDTWRLFVWEHLLGSQAPMMDIIVDRMMADRSLGLVFPEDPHLNDWDTNRDIADVFAVKLRLGRVLPNHFDFPIGTMFWAKPAALQPMIDLDLDWTDFPSEPVPIDGSMLHALERLLPFSAEKAGYRFATTIVDGCTR